LEFNKNIDNFKIISPTINNIELIFTEIISSISHNSLLILDSLNGFIDCLNLLNISKLRDRDKNSSSSSLEINKISSKYSYAGYQSFNILFLLLKKIENNRIPIVVTKYQSLEKSQNMILDLLTTRDFETNHFIRISDLVLFLEFDQRDCKTEFTIIKKNVQGISSSFEPTSDKTDTDTTTNVGSDNFKPYSGWFHFNFLDQKL
jgi:hypothetical protein